MINPLLEEWKTPFGTPPFTKIETSHYKPAIEEAIAIARMEIDRITYDPDAPDFENTVAALDRAGEVLARITQVLFNLNSAETSKALQAVAQDVSPVLTRFSNDITLNEKLFHRVLKVYENRESPGLNTEQKILTEKKYRNFLLGGAGLDEQAKKRFREISEELSTLSLTFEENVLEETNSFELHLTETDELKGLPEGVVEFAAMEAKKREKTGWIFTLHYPSYIPFMQYSEVRYLREKMLRAFSSRGYRNNEHNNKEIIRKIVNLRLEMAKLLGFRNYAELTLGDRMAETPAKVDSFLEELHSASKIHGRKDYNEVLGFARTMGHDDVLERWDWAFYSEKLKMKKYDIDDEKLKPFFRLENVEKAIFDLAGRLYGLKFTENKSIPVYHGEVKTMEVLDEDGSHLAILYTDYFPRPGKSGGAWMTSFRDQRKENGSDIRPLISIVANFTRPTETRPSLLTFSEVTTFLHEFGHALHGMLTRCNYESLSGTSVPRDFVELPSQFMENYAFEREWLDSWAVHYLTGEKIPFEIVEKIREASTYNEGYSYQRQLSFGFLDMAWHKLENPFTGDITEFESSAIEKTELFPKVKGTNVSASFAHIFSGGYAAGYYGYKWAELLDADAFEHFRETGIFNRDTASSFRKNILEKGGTDKPMKLYVNFRGKEPSIGAMLKRSGLEWQGAVS